MTKGRTSKQIRDAMFIKKRDKASADIKTWILIGLTDEHIKRKLFLKYFLPKYSATELLIQVRNNL